MHTLALLLSLLRPPFPAQPQADQQVHAAEDAGRLLALQPPQAAGEPATAAAPRGVAQGAPSAGPGEFAVSQKLAGTAVQGTPSIQWYLGVSICAGSQVGLRVPPRRHMAAECPSDLHIGLGARQTVPDSRPAVQTHLMAWYAAPLPTGTLPAWGPVGGAASDRR